MRSKTALAVCVTALAAGGCGGEDAGDAAAQTSVPPAEKTAPRVPEGVAAQYHQIEEEVAAEGGEQRVGPWRVAYIVEPAEGWFDQDGGELRWRAPAQDETHHIEILPIEASTGRLMPNVPISVDVLDAQGDRVASEKLPMYYAEFLHYANNFAIPRDGEYTLRAKIAPPQLRRHGDQDDDPALAEGATVTFDNVELTKEQ
jgi:hypothetical protein